MQATQQLPEKYVKVSTLSFANNLVLAIVMQVAAAIFFFILGWLFLPLILTLMAQADSNLITLATGIILANIFMLILHEGIHGFFFWFYTRARPRFGLTLAYACAGAPEWYLPRLQYLVVGLAPLAIITIVGLALMPIVSPFVALLSLSVVIFNAAGCVGDLLSIVYLLLKTPHVLVNDTGDVITFYELAAAL